MKAIWNMFAGGLAWLVLGLVLLFGLFFFLDMNIASVHSADAMVPMVMSVDSDYTALASDGFEWFTSPALMSYGLAALVFLWAVYHHRQQALA